MIKPDKGEQMDYFLPALLASVMLSVVLGVIIGLELAQSVITP